MALFPGDMNIGWGFGRELEHCTGSPMCQCPNCRLTEHNAGEAPEDQLDDDSPLYITPLGEAYLAELEAKESQPTDPFLAVSELEERVRRSEEYAGKLSQVCIRHKLEIETLKVHKVDMEQRITDLEERLQHWGPRVDISILEYDNAQQCQHITDLEERLRSMTAVVNVLVAAVNRLEHRIEKE